MHPGIGIRPYPELAAVVRFPMVIPNSQVTPTRAAWGVVALFAIAASAASLISNMSAVQADEINYTRQVQPILAKHCYACHGPDQAESGLRLTDRKSAVAETESGEHAIVPGDSDASGLIARISTEDEFDRMPPEGDRLSADSIELLRRWIDQGAAWEEHWAFEPMQAVDPPAVDDDRWNGHPIDRFIYDSLNRAGLQPNERADRRTLIRRASYDLTGLPPAGERVEAFLQDDDPRAFERLIDELLESPQYGERWGRHWLDLVRYAETNSFERDGAKPNAWKYRDYVIRAFNDDKPYDQFIREQLAGDELPKVTTETLTATGYYRLGIWDDEPADPLQSRYDELDDIITTTGQVFLGLTINCARCHDHKIDPIPQADYYRMLALLADVTTYGTRGDQTGNNQIDVSSQELSQRYRENDQQRRVIESQMREIEQQGIAKMPASDQRATEGPQRDRKRVLDAKLQDHLPRPQWRDYSELKNQLKQVNAEAQTLPPRESVLGLARHVQDPKPTYILFRGNPHAPSDEVSPGFPELFSDPTPEIRAPEQSETLGRRLALADWIGSQDNRLTARVMANRVWQFHFGRGIVESSNNFGRLGTPPTHPELLDWLAQRLIDEGWKLKPLHRLIMTSQTYQLSSAEQSRGTAIDPANERLWRFDPRRLSAEEVRDSILAVNGSLNLEQYGPSIYPTLSQEVLAGQSRPGSGWGKSTQDQQNRRSIYIHIKRSLLHPLLSAFDFPEPDRSCEARFATLQPGQALSLLNSDLVHEQAAHLAAVVAADADATDAADTAGTAATADAAGTAGATKTGTATDAAGATKTGTAADTAGTADIHEPIDPAELVRRVVARVLARPATADEIADGVRLLDELNNHFGLDYHRAAQLYCLSVLNWNEFVFLD